MFLRTKEIWYMRATASVSMTVAARQHFKLPTQSHGHVPPASQIDIPKYDTSHSRKYPVAACKHKQMINDAFTLTTQPHTPRLLVAPACAKNKLSIIT